MTFHESLLIAVKLCLNAKVDLIVVFSVINSILSAFINGENRYCLYPRYDG